MAQRIKQKINTQSSTEAEIVALDDLMDKIVWTKLFIEAQGYPINHMTRGTSFLRSKQSIGSKVAWPIFIYSTILCID